MPIYEFECQECNQRFEQLTGFNYDPLRITCPSCKGDNPRRLISSFGFKGSKASSGSKSCGSCSSSDCSSC